MSHLPVDRAYIVSGMAPILLAPEKNSGWQALHDAYSQIREEIAASDATRILYFSTQWLSVLGYMFQGDPKPKWSHVDQNFHDLGTMHYDFRVDVDFAAINAEKIKELGHHTKVVNYEGFPIDTGTIVAQKLLNPNNDLAASMISCNMYAEKEETLNLGRATGRALVESGEKTVVVLVSNLSNRFFTESIDYAEDHLSSQKDDEWNRKILQLLGRGELEDVSQCAREYAREANGDMGFKGIWWLNGILGESNGFTGKLFEYQPVFGTGAGMVGLYPTGTKTNSPARASGQSVEIKSKIAPEPVGPYPHARRLGDLIFLSGIGPRKKGTKEIPGVVLDTSGQVIKSDIAAQTRSVIENVKQVMEDCGGSLEDIVDIQVFLTDMAADFKIFNEVYKETFGTIRPTRTTVEVGSLPTPIAVEFKIIASLPEAPSK